jgi:uncharacterized sulfatase
LFMSLAGNSIKAGMLGLLLVCATASDAEQAPLVRPNIIVVLIDDMGWSDLACFGNRSAQTPNIDRLAAEGISFTQFYVCAPICSPSRCGLTTGQYPYRWRINSFLDNRKNNTARGMSQWLDPSAPSLARFLKGSGYATGHFGKWHLGGQRDVGDAPMIAEYGFDESLTNFEGLGPRVLPLLNAFDGSTPEKYALGSDSLGHGEIQWTNRNEVSGCFIERAITFIKQAETQGKPFYINLWPDDVHTPLFPSAESRGNGSRQARYHGVLKDLDRELGVLFDFVRSREALRENTVIVLFSDNGPEANAGSSAPLRGGKGKLYEGGIRSPLIVWGNGVLSPAAKGSRNQEAVFVSLDLVPSVLAITGTRPPPEIVFDGEDVSDVLLGRVQNWTRRQPIFWRKPAGVADPPDRVMPELAMRKGQWKLLMRFDGSDPELYDLEKDAVESVNLATHKPELVDSLRGVLRQWASTFPR